MNCEKCGNSFSDDEKLCPKCGAPATPAEQPKPEQDEDILKIQAELNELMNNAENNEAAQNTAEQINETLQNKSASDESEEEKPEETEQPEEETKEETEDTPEETTVEESEEQAEKTAEEESKQEQVESPVQESAEEDPKEEPKGETPEEQPEEKSEEKADEEPAQEQPEEKPGFFEQFKGVILGLPAKTKKIIVISASAAVALALVLVLIFAVIIPAAEPKIDASKYITVVFDSKSQFDGCLSGNITIDREAILSDYKNDIKNELAVTGALDRLLYEANIEYEVEGENSKSNSSLNTVYFDNLESDDELKVTISWAEDSSAKEVIKTEERNSGFKFDKSAVTKNVKISDYLEKQGVELKKPVTLDILDYIKANDLIITLPSEDSLTVGVDRFQTEANGYTLVSVSLYGDSVSIYDKDNNYFTSVYLEVKDGKDLDPGDEVELCYSEENSFAKEAGFLLAGDPVKYTVTNPELLSAESAKKNLASVKEYFSKNKTSLDTDIKSGDVVEIDSIYFSVNKKDESFNKLVIVYTDKTQKYSRALELNRDGFFSGDRFVFYGYTELNEKAKSAEEAVKACECIDEKNTDCTVTKVG